MGCDIHCYIEYREDSTGCWRSFGGRLNPGRNYAIFGLVAGVRDGNALIPPRGFVSDPAYGSSGDNHLFIADSESDDPGLVTRANAEKWVADGSSKYTDDSKKFITHPDWHTHSWLTAKELSDAFEAYEKMEGLHDLPVPYAAMLAAMREFEKRDCESRLVFWFDN